MGKRHARPLPLGAIHVSNEIRELMDRDAIGNAVANLRLGGGTCWSCNKPLKAHQHASLVIDQAATGLLIGFMHIEHGPSQIRDLRRNRRASVGLAHYLDERMTDVDAFASFREYPSPRASLVVSPQTPLSVRADNGDEMHPMFSYWIERGLQPVMSPVIDAEHERVENWHVLVSPDGGVLIACGDSDVLFDGCLPLPQDWIEAVREEGHCAVLYSALNIVSGGVTGRTQEGLDAYAGRGLLIGGIVPVIPVAATTPAALSR